MEFFFAPLLSGPKTAFVWGFEGQDGGPKKVLDRKKISLRFRIK